MLVDDADTDHEMSSLGWLRFLNPHHAGRTINRQNNLFHCTESFIGNKQFEKIKSWLYHNLYYLFEYPLLG